MATYFEVKACFLKQQDNGQLKKVTEQYLVDALSFTEAEARVIQESPDNHRELEIASITRSKISEVVTYGDTDLWHKVKVTYTDIDDNEKEKKQSLYLLVNADTVEQAYERTQEHMKEWLVPFQIPQITESPICEIYQHVAGLRTRGNGQLSMTVTEGETTETPELTPENADEILASRKPFTFGEWRFEWKNDDLWGESKYSYTPILLNYKDIDDLSYENVAFWVENITKPV